MVGQEFVCFFTKNFIFDSILYSNMTSLVLSQEKCTIYISYFLRSIHSSSLASLFSFLFSNSLTDFLKSGFPKNGPNEHQHYLKFMPLGNLISHNCTSLLPLILIPVDKSESSLRIVGIRGLEAKERKWQT